MLRAALLALLIAPFGCSTQGLSGDQLNRLNRRDGGGGTVDLGHGGSCGGDGGIVDGGNPFDGGDPWDAGFDAGGDPGYDAGWPTFDLGYAVDAGPQDGGHHGPHDGGGSPVDLAH